MSCIHSFLKLFPALYFAVVFIVLAGAASLHAETPPPLCTEVDYKIASPTIMAVRCKETDVSAFLASGQIFDPGVGLNNPLQVNVNVTPYPGAVQWLVLEFSSTTAPLFSLQNGKKYKVAFKLHQPGAEAKSDDTPTSFDVDMNNTAVLSPALSTVEKNQFQLVSHYAYKSAPGGLCTLTVEDFSGKPSSIKAKDCRSPAPVSNPSKLSAGTIAQLAPSPEDLGTFIFTLENANMATQQLPTAVPNLLDFLGVVVKIDSKSQLVAEKAPATKDASSYYANFNWAAGKGSVPGWVLDGKIAPILPKPIDGYYISPTALADVGANQVSTIKYTDTIDFGASASHMYRPNEILQGFLVTSGTTYETDREFDRDNLVGTIDFRFNFDDLYNTRQRRSFRQFYDDLQTAQQKHIPWTQENSKPVLFGYILEFHTGFEAGGSLTDTTVKATVGKASANLPAYNIARAVEQVHGLLEISRFSIDVLGTLRYLMTVENTVYQNPDNSLTLARIHGWKAYGVATGSFTLDPAGHFALTLSYKDGFAPPRFNRVNTVLGGITLKY